MKRLAFGSAILWCVSLFGLLVAGCAVAHADEPLDRVTQYIDILTGHMEAFQMDIDEETAPVKLPTDPSPHTWHAGVEKVRISCTQGCATNLAYSEQFDDVPIAAFVLCDDCQDLVTLWGTKSGYAIRIYHVTNRSIYKVLDEASVTAPQVEAVDHGTLVVTLTNPALAVRLKLSSNTLTWRWNGTKFEMISRNLSDVKLYGSEK